MRIPMEDDVRPDYESISRHRQNIIDSLRAQLDEEPTREWFKKRCNWYGEEMEKLKTSNRMLCKALQKLSNEASGFLALSDIERHGQTNSRILRDRIEEARDLLKADAEG